MSALTDRIAEVLRDEMYRHGLDDMGFDERAVAERVAAELALTEERGWTRCSDPQCGDSTWDHDCDDEPRRRWVSAWVPVGVEVQP